MKLQTRAVSENVHKLLKHEAVDRGCSLNTLVIEILNKAAEEYRKEHIRKHGQSELPVR